MKPYHRDADEEEEGHSQVIDDVSPELGSKDGKTDGKKDGKKVGKKVRVSIDQGEYDAMMKLLER